MLPPDSESLEDVARRTKPLWASGIAREVREGKSVLVVRLSEAELTTSNMDSEVMVGVIQGSPIKTLLATLQHVYMPALGQRTSDWAAKLSEESSTEFVGSVGKFVEMLDEAVTSLESGLELAKPCAPHYTQPR